MSFVHTNLDNFSLGGIFSTIFRDYSNDYVYTAAGIFRRTMPPVCPICGAQMNHNGYNTYSKKGLGSVKIGRYICPYCDNSSEEGRSFWEIARP